VQLEVKFAEVSRSGLRQMAFNFFHIDALGRRVGGMTPPPPSLSPVTVPGTSVNGPPPVFTPKFGNAFSVFFSSFPRFPFSAAVSLLESTGLAKVLAEPTLVAMSGQEARFLAGGEFPVPVSTGFGQVGILWKKFGIILAFTPTVVGEGTIQLRLAAEVSDIDPTRSITVGGFSVPGLTSRQSETTVRLADGQSFAIAGLLSNRLRSQIDRIPLLGDIPILGMLFRSVDYQRDESELLVVVTARMAKPLAPHEVPPLPTDAELKAPNDFSLFLLGSEGRNAPEKEERSPEGGGQRAQTEGRGPVGEIGFIR
jgi:pilus assembly protein CpaC